MLILEFVFVGWLLCLFCFPYFGFCFFSGLLARVAYALEEDLHPSWGWTSGVVLFSLSWGLESCCPLAGGLPQELKGKIRSGGAECKQRVACTENVEAV